LPCLSVILFTRISGLSEQLGWLSDQAYKKWVSKFILWTSIWKEYDWIWTIYTAKWMLLYYY